MDFPYVRCDSLYRPDGTEIENPAILITKDDIFCKYGDVDLVTREFDRRVNAYASVGFTEEVANLVMVSFDTFLGLPTETIAYIIRRGMEYTATGFVAKLAYLISNPNNYKDANEQASCIKTWLDAEIERIPIDVTV